MAVNVSKTKFILFHTRGKKINEDDLKIVLNMNEIGKIEDPQLIFPLERIHSKHAKPGLRSYKLLGVHFDEFLSFDQHIGFLCAKLSKILYCLRRASGLLSENSLKLLYVSFVHANLLYPAPRTATPPGLCTPQTVPSLIPKLIFPLKS